MSTTQQFSLNVSIIFSSMSTELESFFSVKSPAVIQIGNIFSDWIALRGGLQQGTWFGPFVVLMRIDDLHTIVLTFKFDLLMTSHVLNISTITQEESIGCKPN